MRLDLKKIENCIKNITETQIIELFSGINTKKVRILQHRKHQDLSFITLKFYDKNSEVKFLNESVSAPTYLSPTINENKIFHDFINSSAFNIKIEILNSQESIYLITLNRLQEECFNNFVFENEFKQTEYYCNDCGQKVELIYNDNNNNHYHYVLECEYCGFMLSTNDMDLIAPHEKYVDK